LVLITSTFLATISVNKVLATNSVAILSYSSYVDSMKDYHIVGEVRNGGTYNLGSVEITAIFYNKTGTMVDTESTYIIVDILKPNQRSPFDIESSFTSSLYNYTIIVSDYEATSEQPYTSLQILNFSNYTDNLGYQHIVGEIQNTGKSNIQSLKIAATYYNKSNCVIDTNYAFTSVDVLIPNQKSPFEIIEKVAPYNYSLVIAGASSNVPYRDFQIISQNSYIDSLKNLNVVGTVKNTGAQNATFVEIIATFYDANGKVVMTDYTYSKPDSLNAGQQASFKLIEPYQVNKINHFTLQVQCNEHLSS
jgi:hypothetical protein